MSHFNSSENMEWVLESHTRVVTIESYIILTPSAFVTSARKQAEAQIQP